MSRAVAGAEIRVAESDLTNPAHADALVAIIDSYARGPEGQNAPISEIARRNLAQGLRAHPMATVLFAFVDAEPVGAAVCVWSFSTFAGKPLVNIHDLAVLPEFRGRGAGHALLAEVERRARERDCCKITLEVNGVNEGAQRLYRSVGFGPWDDPTLFVAKKL